LHCGAGTFSFRFTPKPNPESPLGFAAFFLLFLICLVLGQEKCSLAVVPFFMSVPLQPKKAAVCAGFLLGNL